MGEIDSDTLDAMDWLLDRFERDEAVAYAEVGALDRTKTDIVVTHRGPRETISFPQTGVFCRVYADGAADYRFTQSITETALTEMADRAIRSGTHLAQDIPEQYDPYTQHQATHPGWSSERIDTIETETKLTQLQTALQATAQLSVDRQWVNYTDEHLELAVGTTTGSTVTTSLDRAYLEVQLSVANGPTITRQAGSTRGTPFLDRFSTIIDDAVTAGIHHTQAASNTPPTGVQQVVLTPRASGQLLLYLTRYFEADTIQMGLSPYAVGEQIAAPSLTIDDTIKPGSFAARGYDAELRPTTPVRLVEDGTFTEAVHSTSTAAEAGTTPVGTVIPSLGFEQPPRIHTRHLDVHAGSTSTEALYEDATLLVERFGDPYPVDELERTHRDSHMPASVMYAANVDRITEPRPDVGITQLPIAEGYHLTDGMRGASITQGQIQYQPQALQTITGVGTTRETTSLIGQKHKSQLPAAVTAPALTVQLQVQTTA